MDSKIIIAILLLALCLVVFIYSFTILFVAFKNSFSGVLLKNKIQRLNKNLEQAKSILLVGDPIAAKKSFIASFHLGIQSNLNDVERIYIHNSNIVRTLSSLSRDYSLLYRSIPVIEELLLNRKALNVSLLDTKSNQKNLRGKLLQKPSWALTEFDKKVKELTLAMNTNHSSILTELERLFEQFNTKSQSNFH